MMEKQLKCVLLLSLREMALRRVAGVLWSSSDISASISKIPNFWPPTEANEKKWREVTEKVEDGVSKLELPESLKKPMIDIVRPMSLDVKTWKEFLHQSLQEFSLPGSVKLCWTTAGEIDYCKTAEELVRCDVLSIERRYKIACEYCLEDSVPIFLEELVQEKKEKFYKEGPISPDLEVFWPRILQGELHELDYDWDRGWFTLNQAAFEHSAKNGLKTATAYFFQKLTHEEREASLMRTARAVLKLADTFDFNFQGETLSDVSFYLLSIMTPEQQMEIIKARPVEVLLIFLQWPQQDLFLKNADLIWTFISPDSYDSLLSKMEDVFDKYEKYFAKLFQEFFIQSPRDFKKYSVEQGARLIHYFLSDFFYRGDSETIGAIFRNVDAEDKVSLIFHPRMLSIFRSSMVEDRWHPVEVCLREAALSKEDRQRLKDNFMEYIKEYKMIGWEKRNLKRFFEFLDGTNAGADKEKRAMKRKLRNCSPE